LNRGELLSAWFDDERHAAYAIIGGSFFGNFARVEIFGLFGRRDDDSPASDDRPRALQRLASDRIQHNVDVTNHIFKSNVRIVDRFVRTDGAEKGKIVRRSSSDDVRLPPFSKLDSEAAHTSCSTLDQ
jgi:hypothetical protein